MNGNILTGPIEFALQETIKRFENPKSVNDIIARDSLMRSKEMWDRIRIYGIETTGNSYSQFVEQIEEKNNILFLTDEELERYNKAMRLYSLISKELL